MRLVTRLIAAFALAALPLLGAQPTLAAGGVPSITDPRYFAGANVPWVNWGCDFGCSTTNGASSAGTKSAMSAGLAQLKAAGVHTVRWWTFEGDPWQINHDSSGAPTSLNPAVYTDFDAALALADQYDVAYDFVLFSSPTALPHSWVADPGQRQKLADVLAPLFDRYKNNPHILAWEIFNEPEWDIWSNKIQQAPVQATVSQLASTIHAHTSTPVTVGSANLDGLSMWAGQGLDFLSPHWYDPMTGTSCARCTDTTALAAGPNTANLPVVIGEFYAGSDVDTLQRFKDLRAKGYAGAWAWSLLSDHTSDHMKIDLGAVTSFTSALAAQPTPQPSSSPSGASQPSAPVPAAGSPVQLGANWVSPTFITPGDQITIHQDVQSAKDVNVLVDFEVYDQNGNKVWQQPLDNQQVSGSALSSFSTSMTTPSTLPAGQYTVKTGVFTPGWGTMLAWSDAAGSFTVDTTNLAPPAIPTVVPAVVQPGTDDPSDTGATDASDQ